MVNYVHICVQMGVLMYVQSIRCMYLCKWVRQCVFVVNWIPNCVHVCVHGMHVCGSKPCLYECRCANGCGSVCGKLGTSTYSMSCTQVACMHASVCVVN